jgi:hypothetical protein
MKKYKFTQEEILKNGKIIRHLVLDIEDSSKWRELFDYDFNDDIKKYDPEKLIYDPKIWSSFIPGDWWMDGVLDPTSIEGDDYYFDHGPEDVHLSWTETEEEITAIGWG